MRNYDIIPNVRELVSCGDPKFSRSHTDRAENWCRSDRSRPGSKADAVKTECATVSAHPEIPVFCLRNPIWGVRKESILYSPCGMRILGKAHVRVQCVSCAQRE